MPTGEQRKLIAALEDQAALISQMLGWLKLEKARARSREAQRAIQAEIDYKISELARVHRDRDAIARQLGETEGKRKR